MRTVLLRGLTAFALAVSSLALPGCDAPEEGEVEEEQEEEDEED